MHSIRKAAARGTRTPSRAALRAAAALGVALLLGACASDSKDEFAGRNAEKLYAEAKQDLEGGSYERAIKALERVEGLGAGTLLSQQAQLDLAYAHWKANDKVQALATVDRFIKYNPSSPALDYALYLRGVIDFNDNLGLLGGLAGQDLSERDQRASRDAWQSFKQLVDQFPTSRYAADARQRMDYIVNALARYEVHVARYYYNRGAYLAAANRAQKAVTEFQQSPAVEEALIIMAHSYDKLQLVALRDDTLRVLRSNYPDRALTPGALPKTAQAPWWRFW